MAATNNLPLRELEPVQKKIGPTLSSPEIPLKMGDAFRQKLHNMLASTDEIFENLNHSDTELLANDELVDVSGRLQRLVGEHTELLSKPQSTRPELADVYSTIEGQRVRLDSLAETFRIAADPATKERTRSLIEAAACEVGNPPKTNWREFVGSLHD